MGFDDLSISRRSDPPPSTIHHPACERGQGAASATLSLLRGDKPALQLPEPRGVARESMALRATAARRG